MFGLVNLLIIIVFICATIWSVRESYKPFQHQHRASQLLFNLSAGLLAGWFFIVGVVYCLNDLLHLTWLGLTTLHSWWAALPLR